MVTIADFVLPAEEFALSKTLNEIEDARFETIRVTAHGTDRVLPLFWGKAPESGHDALVEALETDPSVEDLTLLTTFEDEMLFEMDWVADVAVLTNLILTRGATILAAHGGNSDWHFRALCPTRESLSETYDFCLDSELRIDIKAIRDVNAPGKGEHGLTSSQHDSLVTTFSAGYYTVPREITLSDLADEMDVFHQALSERLRRGHSTLVEGTLIVGRPTALEDQNPPDDTDSDFPSI